MIGTFYVKLTPLTQRCQKLGTAGTITNLVSVNLGEGMPSIAAIAEDHSIALDPNLTSP